MIQDQPSLQIITWLLIIVGWGIVNHQNNIRETRKEARSMADEAKTSVVNTCTAAIAYFSDSNETGAAELKSSLELLEIELERFPLFKDGSTLMVKFLNFNQAIMGGDFESLTREIKGLDSAEVKSLRRSRNALLAEIERQFRIHFC